MVSTMAGAQGTVLPGPSRDPLAIDRTADPILKMAREAAPTDYFRQFVGYAVQRHPALGEARADGDEARAARSEARAVRNPRVDVTLSAYRTIDREFSNDPQNIIERSRANRRTDALLTVEQPLIDFGASSARLGAASARLRGAAAGIDNAAADVALRAIAAWYDVYAYRALVALGEAFAANQQDLAKAVDVRIQQGVSAPGDVARVTSYTTATETRLARYRRALAGAEAQFQELFGVAAPDNLGRAPPSDGPRLTRDAAAAAAAETPAARTARAEAEAARLQAKATRADTQPVISAGVDAGRYGVFETDRDYDIRGRITARARLFGGIGARAQQAEARAASAEARAARILEEGRRDAIIAWSDVEALETQQAALERSYVAGRQSRDVLFERFRVARGSLFDVLASEDTFFETATAYVQGVAELDAARYVLLSRTGRLLDALQIAPADAQEAR